jgi:hypothetical protein
MARIALYLVCATGLTVIGARMIHWTTSEAHAQYAHDDWRRAEREWCRDSAAHRPEIPPVIRKPAEEHKEKSRIVRTLLGLIDEFDPDDNDGKDNDRNQKNAGDGDEFDGDYNSSETRDLMRRVLREADPELARSLGKNSLRLIAEANCKPKRLAIYLHCEKLDRRHRDEIRNGVHVIEFDKDKHGGDDRFDDDECEHIVYPLRWGTVEKPIPPKNDPRPEVERRQRERARQANETSGEDPFGAK